MRCPSDPLRIGIAGLGTVGTGTVRLLQTHDELIRSRCGRHIRIAAVSARDRRKGRGVDVSAARWYDDAVAMAGDPELDAVVELVGGADGVALALVRAAIGEGRHVVTANKAMMAERGCELARAAEQAGVTLAYEASVAGGIPVIKLIREGLAANGVSRVYGILNGTSNYILSVMRESGREFDDVLAEAQALGYAESDPSFDVDGVDAAHKLAILTSLAFGCEVDFGAVHIEGIRHVSAMDIRYAGELGYKIKLLGVARRTDEGVEQRVHPCMVPAESPIGSVEGVYNGVVAEGDFAGSLMAEGRGAGAGPTASAVVADLIDIARGNRPPTFAVAASALAPSRPLPMDSHRGPYYIRLTVVDLPGVIADVTAIFRDFEISIESIVQRGRAPGETVSVVMIVHETAEAAMTSALARIAKLDSVTERPQMIRIEDF
jgi:homoserine dehydrogenase